MRIVAGRWAGRTLVSPADRRVRPTAEAVRDAWLRSLQPHLEGARILDLFAGSGALGLEALSRGAAVALFLPLLLNLPAVVQPQSPVTSASAAPCG